MKNDNEEWRIYSNDWADRAKGVIFIVVLMVLLLIGLSYCSNARAQEAPEGVTSMTVPFNIHCTSPQHMRKILLDTHGEIALVAGFLEDGLQLVWYGSKDNTTMSWVIQKNEMEACLVWSGRSPDGNATVANPAPQWPEGKGEEWNL